MYDEDHEDVRSRVLYAVVHGYYEGHIAGELSARGDGLESGPMPAMPESPWPSPGDAGLAAVAKQLDEWFDPEDAEGRVAAAAALGWALGRQAGLECPGCITTEAVAPGSSRAIRGGRFGITITAKDPDDQAAMNAGRRPQVA